MEKLMMNSREGKALLKCFIVKLNSFLSYFVLVTRMPWLI